jgi:hypothetical protein
MSKILQQYYLTCTHGTHYFVQVEEGDDVLPPYAVRRAYGRLISNPTLGETTRFIACRDALDCAAQIVIQKESKGYVRKPSGSCLRWPYWWVFDDAESLTGSHENRKVKRKKAKPKATPMRRRGASWDF